jgi:hypothetical protein
MEELRKTMKSLRIAGVPAEIRNKHLLNTREGRIQN